MLAYKYLNIVDNTEYLDPFPLPDYVIGFYTAYIYTKSVNTSEWIAMLDCLVLTSECPFSFEQSLHII